MICLMSPLMLLPFFSTLLVTMITKLAGIVSGGFELLPGCVLHAAAEVVGARRKAFERGDAVIDLSAHLVVLPPLRAPEVHYVVHSVSLDVADHEQRRRRREEDLRLEVDSGRILAADRAPAGELMTQGGQH